MAFRQSPTFEDCFPSSEKLYKTVEHDGSTLQVTENSPVCSPPPPPKSGACVEGGDLHLPPALGRPPLRSQVPFRRVTLTGGSGVFDIYDTSGPQGIDPRSGLPKIRSEWIAKREARGDTVFTQARSRSVTAEACGMVARHRGRSP